MCDARRVQGVERAGELRPTDTVSGAGSRRPLERASAFSAMPSRYSMTTYGTSSSTPPSRTVTTWGWSMRVRCRTWRVKARRAAGPGSGSCSRTVTVRFVSVSSASHILPAGESLRTGR